MYKNYNGNNPYFKDEKEENMKEYNNLSNEIKHVIEDISKLLDESFITKCEKMKELSIIRIVTISKFAKCINEVNKLLKSKNNYSVLCIYRFLCITHEYLIIIKSLLKETNEVSNTINYIDENICNILSKCKDFEFNHDSFYKEIVQIKENIYVPKLGFCELIDLFMSDLNIHF